MATDNHEQISDGTLAEKPMPEINRVANNAPIQWLKLGWRDLKATHYYGLFYGLMFVLMGWATTWVYATKWQLTMGLIAGFFLMGPFVCTGVYDLSRQLEQTSKVSLLESMVCWKRNIGSIAFFAFVLTFTMIVWARVSLVIFALFSNTSFPTLQDVISNVFSFSNAAFLLIWLGVGFVFASLVFAIGVVSISLMLDRRSDTFMAIFTSARALHANPRALYLWAAMIVLIIGASLLLGFIPLLFTAPLIGHATWHAYKSLVSGT